ncbi:MAG: FKBP-type peptidyl-prolyl cis-trans isomerase [Pirellulales bacterium]
MSGRRSPQAPSARRATSRARLRLEVLEPRQVLAHTLVAVGSDLGPASTPLIRLMDAETGSIVAQTLAFEEAFRGGARVALANIDGLPGDEIIAASGPGRIGEIRVFTQDITGGGTTLRELTAYRLRPFGSDYLGGVQAVGGDVDGNGFDDIIATASRGPGRVSVFRAPAFGGPMADSPAWTFRAFDRRALGGGSVAVGDFGTFTDGTLVDATKPDGKVELVVASGTGMSPEIRVVELSTPTPRVVDTIRPFSPGLRTGMTVTTGRFNADRIDDIIATSGTGGPGTEIYDGQVATAANPKLASFAAFAGLSRAKAAAFVAGIDRNGDGQIDAFVGGQGNAGGGVSNGLAFVSQAGSRSQTFTSVSGPARVAAARAAYDFTTTLSGIQYRVVTQGTGSLPSAGQTVTTHYTGWLRDGTKFDSSRDKGTPFTFTLGQGQVIAGWDQMLAEMRVGERRTVIIPANLAYGSTARPGIPANSPLVFDIELVSAT